MVVDSRIYKHKTDFKEGLKSFFMPLLDKQILGNDVIENIDYEIDNSVLLLLETLRDDLWFYVEFPYTDALYKDSYSRYYSTSLKSVGRFCLRVSLFCPEENKEPSENLDALINDCTFCGYFIIKPNKPMEYGRTFLNPLAFKERNFVCCLSEINTHINGFKLTSKAFPHSTQDGVAYSCSEIVIWSIMEYFGSKYSKYGTILPSNIHKILRKISFERQLPSPGMTYYQLGYTLRKMGFGSMFYVKSILRDSFFTTINDYVESGIPVIAIIGNKSKKKDKKKKHIQHFRHSTLIIGHETINEDTQTIDYKNAEEIDICESDENDEQKVIGTFEIADSVDCLKKKFVFIDDNCPPYRISSLENPGHYYNETSVLYNSEIKEIIIPLYPKIYLDSRQARKAFREILTSNILGWKIPDKKLISRIYLTSSNSFKREVRSRIKNESHLEYILEMVLPKFIWVMELAEASEYLNFKAIGLIILDSTSSRFESIENQLLVAMYPDRIMVKDEVKFKPLPGLNEPFSLYRNNLKKI